MAKRFIIGAVLVLASAAGIAQIPTSKPGAPDRTRVSGGTYQVDPNHTLVSWNVDHLGFSDYFGLFGDVTGTLRLDPANPSAAKLDVSIPIEPVVASKGLHDHLLRVGKDGKAPDFFGPNQKPARFVSTRVTPSPDGASAYVLGNLTLNGKTRPVAIQTNFTGAGTMMGKENIGFSGHAVIRRSDFGVMGALPLVSDEVELTLSGAFMKDAAGDPPARPELGPNACNAEKAKPWIGKKAIEDVRAEVAKATGAKTIRWISPGQAVTADYRPDRLNMGLAARTAVIVKASCG